MMQLVASYEGTEEWFCPVCGYHFFMTLHPFHRDILAPGDYNVAHSGSVGLDGLAFGLDGDVSQSDPFGAWIEEHREEMKKL